VDVRSTSSLFMDSFAKDTLAWYKARLSDRLGYLKYASERKIMGEIG